MASANRRILQTNVTIPAAPNKDFLVKRESELPAVRGTGNQSRNCGWCGRCLGDDGLGFIGDFLGIAYGCFHNLNKKSCLTEKNAIAVLKEMFLDEHIIDAGRILSQIVKDVAAVIKTYPRMPP